MCQYGNDENSTNARPRKTLHITGPYNSNALHQQIFFEDARRPAHCYRRPLFIRILSGSTVPKTVGKTVQSWPKATKYLEQKKKRAKRQQGKKAKRQESRQTLSMIWLVHSLDPLCHHAIISSFNIPSDPIRLIGSVK